MPYRYDPRDDRDPRYRDDERDADFEHRSNEPRAFRDEGRFERERYGRSAGWRGGEAMHDHDRYAGHRRGEDASWRSYEGETDAPDERHDGQEYGLEQEGGGYGGGRRAGKGAGYGQSGSSQPSDEPFDADYLRWRDDQLRGHDREYAGWRRAQHQRYDEEYRAWRNERREHFHRSFHDWRSQNSNMSAGTAQPFVTPESGSTGAATSAAPGASVLGQNATQVQAATDSEEGRRDEGRKRDKDDREKS